MMQVRVEKGVEGAGWEATLNQEESQSFPDTCHVEKGHPSIKCYVW